VPARPRTDLHGEGFVAEGAAAASLHGHERALDAGAVRGGVAAVPRVGHHQTTALSAMMTVTTVGFVSARQVAGVSVER
jgi:hypothetical protein